MAPHEVRLQILAHFIIIECALRKAADLCEEAIAAVSQSGEACNDEVLRAGFAPSGMVLNWRRAVLNELGAVLKQKGATPGSERGGLAPRGMVLKQ